MGVSCGDVVTELWRSMRPDVFDMRVDLLELMHHQNCMDLRKLVLEAIAHGSDQRSPFLHASKSFEIVRRKYWQNSQVQHAALCIVKIDINKWDGRLGDFPCEGWTAQKMCIDMSSPEKQLEFFRTDDVKAFGGQQGDFQYLRGAQKDEEVLIKWRGCVPISIMSVVDPTDGTVVEPFLDFIQRETWRQSLDTW